MRVVIVAVQMECVSQIDAGQHGENIGLNKRDTDFQPVHRDGKGERQPADQHPAADCQPEQHSQDHVARRHVGEQPDGQRNRPG